MERACPFNDAVVCDSKECYHCGWDPEVAKARQEELVKAMNGEKLYKVPFTGYCEVWANSPEEALEKAETVEQQFTASYDYGEPICLEKEENNELD
jgi:hypothetical protein